MRHKSTKFGTGNDGRRCPVCGRGAALKLNEFYGFRYCRWAERGMCEFTEDRAYAEQQAMLARADCSRSACTR